MCAQNLKSVAIPVPEIIGGTQKIGAVPGYVPGIIAWADPGFKFGGQVERRE